MEAIERRIQFDAEINAQDRARKLARLFVRADRSGGDNACWLWTGGRTAAGYGIASYRSRVVVASRLALILTSGDPGKGDVAKHRCGNNACINPNHVYWSAR